MKKDESLFVRTGDTPSRESIYNLFSGTTFHVNEPPRIEAKVSMQTDQHDPDFFQNIIAKIQIRPVDAEWNRNIIITSLDLLLTRSSEEVFPWIQSYLSEGRKPGDKAFGKEMMKIGTVIAEYVDAFAGLDSEPPDFEEAKEREEVQKFLTGEVLHHLGDFRLSVSMMLHQYDSDGFKDTPASIGVHRTDGSFSGHILAKVKDIYSFDINAQLDALSIAAIEAGAISDYIRLQLHRFETLGPMSVTTTPDSSCSVAETTDTGYEELRELVIEINRIIEERESKTDHSSTIVSNAENASLTKHGEVDKPNQEDLNKLIQLCKQIISQVENQCHTNPFNTDYF